MHNPLAGLLGDVALPATFDSAASLLAAVVPKFRPGSRADVETPTGFASFERSATVLVHADALGTVRGITPNAREVLGDACERAAEFNLHLAEVLQPEDEAEVDRLISRLLQSAGEVLTFELLTRAPSGAPRWLELWSRHDRTDELGSGLYFEIRDITLQRADR